MIRGFVGSPNREGLTAAIVREALLGVGDQHPDLNEAQMAERFRDIERSFGPDHAFTREVLQGRSSEGAASAILQGSILADSASTAAAVAMSLARRTRNGGALPTRPARRGAPRSRSCP